MLSKSSVGFSVPERVLQPIVQLIVDLIARGHGRTLAGNRIISSMAHEGESDISPLVARLTEASDAHERIQHLSSTHLPNRDVVLWILEQLHCVLFPGFFGLRDLTEHTLQAHVDGKLREVRDDLTSQVEGPVSGGDR